ncbi:hypothetical protein E4U41_006235 [Claviceps citrina]|nr:hypothetical protein E4U41_006235 [Claviceps citrina]
MWRTSRGPAWFRRRTPGFPLGGRKEATEEDSCASEAANSAETTALSNCSQDRNTRITMRLSALSAALLAGLAGTAQAEDASDLKSILLRTHSIQQPYLDSDMQSRWFDFGGDALIRTDAYIRLTSDLPSQSGWLFSRVPLTATNWEVEVEFQISGKNHLYGDGFAMWITKQRGERGEVFGSIDRFEGLGIFVDTYKNNRPGVVFPYVMAMYGDGSKSYNKNDDGKESELAGCSARGIRHASVPTKLRLTYIQDKQLRLDLQYKEEDEWTSCFVVDKPPQIPNIAYLGFSAETGELSDNHDIISVTTKNLYKPAVTSNNGAGTSKGRNVNSDQITKGKGTWTMFFIKIFLFLFVVGGGYIGYTAYRAKNRSHRF